jgi:signal transduction histidine kinase/CheY-like chemotaxis protein
MADLGARGAAQQLLDALDHGVVMLDAGGAIVGANLLGQKLADSAGVRTQLAALAKQAQQAPDGTAERTLNIGGSTLAVRARRAGEGQTALTFRDESSENERNVELVQKERLASVGMLAGAVGYEISNPSAAVMHNLRALADSVAILAGIAGDPKSVAPLPLVVDEFVGEAKVILAECTIGMERIHTLVRDLRSLMQGDSDTTAQADANAVIESSLSMVAADLRHRSRVERDLRASMPVRCSAARLGHVLMSLLTNAAQALDHRQFRRNRVLVRTFDQGRDVIIEVHDNGQGIAPDVLPRVFEYLFTTKPRGQGTGLGLTVASEIVRSAGGELTVQSAPGSGSTFRVRLPGSRVVRPSQIRLHAPTTAPPRRARILVVDDEVLLLKAYRRMMGKIMDVETAEGAEQAIARIEEGHRFDVVLCDLSMPKMSGIEFHRLVQGRWPELARRFVFATGGAINTASREFLERTTVPWIEKPVAHDRLISIIEQVSAA